MCQPWWKNFKFLNVLCLSETLDFANYLKVILTACPAQTIYRLFAQVTCARKEQLHYFQLALPLPELEFATVNVRVGISIQSSGMFSLKIPY